LSRKDEGKDEEAGKMAVEDAMPTISDSPHGRSPGCRNKTRRTAECRDSDQCRLRQIVHFEDMMVYLWGIDPRWRLVVEA
jgi:hypothetical protein